MTEQNLLRALVVEDDPSWQQILREILEDCGLAVDLVDNHTAALEKIRRGTHRLAVLDLSLAGIDHHNQDGLLVLKGIRRHDPGCVPIFLTGFATVELAVDVIRSGGAFTCLRKETFRRAEFRRVIHDALAKPPYDPALGSELEDIINPAHINSTTRVDSSLSPGMHQYALLVEDDAGWRRLLTELLEESDFSVQPCSSYVEALGKLQHEKHHIAVIDLSLASSLEPQHNEDGFRLLEHTHKAGIPTIIVSGYANPEQIEQAYTAYKLFACLEKQSFDRKAFLETIQQAAIPPDPRISLLTERELEVLALLARGLTNKEIAGELYISPNTVKRHLKSLFTKLDVNTRAAATAIAINLGIPDA